MASADSAIATAAVINEISSTDRRHGDGNGRDLSRRPAAFGGTAVNVGAGVNTVTINGQNLTVNLNAAPPARRGRSSSSTPSTPR